MVSLSMTSRIKCLSEFKGRSIEFKGQISYCLSEFKG